jgi:RNA polymerase sigma-70 factor (ECF subfamily)
VARRRAIDRLRREAARRPREHEAAVRLLDDDRAVEPVGGDDRLRLLFTCCHPALSREAQIALALRTICRLTTVEIARVFLVPEPTVGQRISRAKSKIAKARIPYRIPDAHELPDRLPPVLATIYSVFTVGHHSPGGALDARVDLAEEAIRLGRVLVSLMPDEAECAGLLALLLAAHARRAARLDTAGDVVLLADQDRSRWDHAAIAEASALVEGALRRGRPGPYQLQAAIACLHGDAATWADTDWAQIVELYDLLAERWPTPVVQVNRAVAVGELHGPAAALRELDEVDESAVGQWHLYWSARAELLRRTGDPAAAADAFRQGLLCPCNDADRRFLERRLAEVTG